jgi:hypothetical protein
MQSLCFDFANVVVGIVIVKTELLMSQHRNETFGIINWATCVWQVNDLERTSTYGDNYYLMLISITGFCVQFM